MINSAHLSHFSHFLPKHRVTSLELEATIAKQSPSIRVTPGVIEELTHINSRPISAPEVQASDLAVEAGKLTLLKAQLHPSQVDLLIFASASQDILEPATANIVQVKLGLSCPVFDVKNACNSFLNGIEVALGLVTANQYQTILVVTGETPSKLAEYSFSSKPDFKAAFASFTLGDAGGAVLVQAQPAPSNVLYHRFYTDGKYWQAASVLGGGSLYPRDPDKVRFSSQPNLLKDGFQTLGLEPLKHALQETKMELSSFKRIFIHQVATAMTDITIQFLGLPSDKVYRTVEKHGNLASASLPTAISESVLNDEIKPGDLILILGLASGISASIWVVRV